MASSWHLSCIDQNDVTYEECVISVFEQAIAQMRQQNNQLQLVLYGALVFLMQPGFAMLCAGSVRTKNVGNTLLKNFSDACVGGLAFFSCGYALAFGDDADSSATTFAGTRNFFGIWVEDYGFWFFQYAFCAAATTIVAGTIAERASLHGYYIYALVLSGLVYPIVSHAVWSKNGFLSAFNVDPLLGVGMVDFSGSVVVHMCGGVAALCAALVLGPRQDRFGNPKLFLETRSVTAQILGSFLLWFGWYGFNPGTALTLGDDVENKGDIAALAAVNTTISASFGALSATLIMYIIHRVEGKVVFELHALMYGGISGLVGITAGCGVVDPWAAALIGTFSGGMFLLMLAMIHQYNVFDRFHKGDHRLKIDDAVDAIAIHLGSGFWGAVAVGLFAEPGRMEAVYGSGEHAGAVYPGNGDLRLLSCQLIGIVFVFAWVGTIMTFVFYVLRKLGLFRVHSQFEKIGLDPLTLGKEKPIGHRNNTEGGAQQNENDSFADVNSDTAGPENAPESPRNRSP